MRAHYDIIYKNIIRKSDNTTMDLNCFFDALEEVGFRLFKKKDPYENFREVIQTLDG